MFETYTHTHTHTQTHIHKRTDTDTDTDTHTHTHTHHTQTHTNLSQLLALDELARIHGVNYQILVLFVLRALYVCSTTRGHEAH